MRNRADYDRMKTQTAMLEKWEISPNDGREKFLN